MTYEHTASGKASRTEVYTYSYDEKDRLSKIMHKLGSTTVTLAEYTYDALGRLATTKLHGNNTNTATYSYNIRNWLTGISSSKFTQDLDYDNHYNGNISSIDWTANDTSHSYTFTYDGVNRMLDATHGTGAYTEKVTSYDKNGNIKALQRYGNGLIDNLTYTYSGNQLTRVDDATGNAAGFSNGASTADEYTYDNNGNLTKDSNKGISNIAYNCLNLPSTVTFSDGSTITYSYAADGTKLRTVHTISGTVTQKDYCANVVYENGIQKMLLTEEGYVDLSASTPAYYYYLKDHQGNNRVVLSSGGTAVEVSHYYPFGGVFASTGNVQPFKYNGKELDTKKGLNWYDYGARHYDATLGRWFAVDPLAEKMYAWSPYAYCFNNPMKYVDEKGEIPWLVSAAVGAFVDYGFQVIQNVAEGQSFVQSLTNVNTKSIMISAAASATGVGLGNVVAKGIKAVQIGAKAGKVLQFSGDIAVDATMSVTSQVISGEGISAEKVVVDIIAGTVGGKVGDKTKSSAQRTETGKRLHREADRAQRLAGENSRTSRKKRAVKANETANNYGESSSTAASTLVTSTLENLFELYDKDRKR